MKYASILIASAMISERKPTLNDLKQTWIDYYTEHLQRSKKRKLEINTECFRFCQRKGIQFRALETREDVEYFVNEFLIIEKQ